MNELADFKHFEIPGVAHFRSNVDGLISLHLETRWARAEIFLQGAHLTRFEPHETAPLLFVSKQSAFSLGKSIRGGVPICFPWFGPRANHPKAPAHGFARTVLWTVKTVSGSAEAGVKAIFQLDSNAATRALWPFEFRAQLELQVAQGFELTLDVENTGNIPFTYEDALHTYLAVADVRAAALSGLESAAFLDKTDNMRRKEAPAASLVCTAETDRVFPNHSDTCTLQDSGNSRTITIEKHGSRSTVVWNPWSEKAAALRDMCDDEWIEMLCVETANVGGNAITLAPGERHATTARISVI